MGKRQTQTQEYKTDQTNTNKRVQDRPDRHKYMGTRQTRQTQTQGYLTNPTNTNTGVRDRLGTQTQGDKTDQTDKHGDKRQTRERQRYKSKQTDTTDKHRQIRKRPA